MYRLFKAVLRRFFRLLFRPVVVGSCRFPADRPLIVVCNHRSNWDPPFLGAMLDDERPVRYMAKQELFAGRWQGWLMRQCGAFPVRRGTADRQAIKMAMDILSGNGIVGLFPEGTRSKTGELGKGAAGVALIAVKTGAMIVPCALSGTELMFKPGVWRPVLKLAVGEPFTLMDEQVDQRDLAAVTELVMARIRRQLEILDGYGDNQS
ncbi:MAG: 1-acyl-sn-glycerol-3-phosphate acyltransferase [Negativicutes bacterium]|nr:1-acyl-sn-glycerol-3-phosphate acyltransferase [Negativicutes bacterium]